MTQDFEDLLRQRHFEQQKQRRLAADTRPEWDILKSLVSQFAIDNKGIGDKKFKWYRSADGHFSLVLGNVAATFFNTGEREGIPQRCKVLFSRKEGLVVKSPFPDRTWSLDPEILKGEFAWAIREVGEVFRPSQLAEEIATELTRYHLSYEKQGQKAFGVF